MQSLYLMSIYTYSKHDVIKPNIIEIIAFTSLIREKFNCLRQIVIPITKINVKKILGKLGLFHIISNNNNQKFIKSN